MARAKRRARVPLKSKHDVEEPDAAAAASAVAEPTEGEAPELGTDRHERGLGGGAAGAGLLVEANPDDELDSEDEAGAGASGSAAGSAE